MVYHTKARELVKNFLSERVCKTCSLEEIYEYTASFGCGKSTVYRIVGEMVRAGTVKKTSDGVSRSLVYQYIGDGGCMEHLHLKCRSCGALIHLDKQTSDELTTKLGGFSPEKGATLYGECQTCTLRSRKGDGEI